MLDRPYGLEFFLLPFLGWADWLCLRRMTIPSPSYRDPHMAKIRESRPSEARPATKTPAGSFWMAQAACWATGWGLLYARTSRIGTREAIHMWPSMLSLACTPTWTTPLAAGEMGREGAIPRPRQPDSNPRVQHPQQANEQCSPGLLKQAAKCRHSPLGHSACCQTP